MLEDSVIVNMESIRDNDRLTLLQAKPIISMDSKYNYTPSVPVNP